jgi:hypothetical protein
MTDIPTDRGSHLRTEARQSARLDRLFAFSPYLLLLGRIDPYGQVEFGSSDVAAIRDEVGRLVALAQEGQERRGLMRLQALAAHGGRIPGSVLRSLGD